MTGETNVASSGPDGGQSAESTDVSSERWSSSGYTPIYPRAFLPGGAGPDAGRSVLTTQVEEASKLGLPALEVFGVDQGVTDPDSEREVRLQPRTGRPDSPATFCTRIDWGGVWTEGFVAFTPSGHYLADSIRTPRLLRNVGLPLEEDGTIGELPPPVSSSQTAVLIGNRQAQNHFHWLFESVARLGVLAGADLGDELEGAKYIVPELTAGQRESLLRAGIRTEQLLTPTDPFVQFLRLYVPSRGLDRIYRFSRTGVAFLRGLAPDRNPSRRIYLSRRNSRRRRLENETEVVSTLSRHGFEEVAAESLNFDEQIEIFSQADAIAAPHGAGLANIPFMPAGGAVLEIQPEGLGFSGTVMYRSLAAVAEHRYGVLVGATGASRHSIQVDPGLLDKLTRELL